MGVVINGPLDFRWPSLLDQRSGKLQGNIVVPYDDVAQALLLPSTRRAIGLVLYITNPTDVSAVDWYQFQGGIADGDLKQLVFGSKLTGDVASPGGTIVLPPGKLYREILLSGVGHVSIGTTEGGSELMDDVDISPEDGVLYTGYINRKSVAAITLFVETENSISYEIFAV